MPRLIIAPIDARGFHPSASQTSIERILSEEGFHIDHAGDATEAVHRFTVDEHDLIILTHDPNPEKSALSAGSRAVQSLRVRAAQEGRRFVPVLMMSSAPEHAAIVEARDLGADDVLHMGLLPALLMGRVRAYLALSGRTGHKSHPLREGLARGKEEKLRHDLTQRLVHDLRNPLAGLSSNLAYVDDRLGTAADPEVLEALADCRSAVGRLRRAATMLVDLGRLEEGVLEPRRLQSPLVPLVQDLFAQRLHEATLRDIKLIADIPPGLSASFDPELTQRLLHALLDHALRYAQTGSTVLLRARLSDAGTLQLLVEGEGEWLPRSERAQLGRLSTPPGMNAGLGLHYAYLAAQAHGGSLEVVDEPTSGVGKTTVLVKL